MAQLIQMRQRIKAIETIKKVTHAMRLISMSTHSRLKGKERALNTYTNELKTIFQQLRRLTPAWKHAMSEMDDESPKRTVIILVGSQKGLCGNFNSALFKLLEQHQVSLNPADTDYIAIGKKAIEFIKQQPSSTLVTGFADFSAKNLLSIAELITSHVTTRNYTTVLVASNVLKTFFIQKPTIHTLVPLDGADTNQPTTDSEHPYCWEQNPADILDVLANQYLEAIIHNLLFKSLLAEQAARFLSMDSSTRNATRLLDATKLQYNKLRQAKITREISELTGSF